MAAASRYSANEFGDRAALASAPVLALELLVWMCGMASMGVISTATPLDQDAFNSTQLPVRWLRRTSTARSPTRDSTIALSLCRPRSPMGDNIRWRLREARFTH